MVFVMVIEQASDGTLVAEGLSNAAAAAKVGFPFLEIPD
jgi:hypothetical protein